ncbi:helix-turn-helix transcriptional regulator [Erythrobacter sp. YJ-T3-07]|uniref:helix-turn-helix domain-containing protein n=1 Tax=Erythrobacter sp. YJ-T3-07 TaxID=2793063 RepID=UPI0018D48D9F|nr:helix-turn-helix transcriptional regulator [Erythrobacter sp. YJ-T3-07]MBH1943999.1 helix-turn-helix transcriptional regulator [Erythrobacter sp. YJ-T3-07]
MTAHQLSSDAAAVARLTDKERECLRLWLGHATAKEIAIRLGVTHHAVEKRLKSARHKLDVTSSLEAARIVARSEGYGGTISGPPELSDGGRRAQIEGLGARIRSAAPRFNRHRLFLAAGVPIMSMIFVLALALTGQPGSDARALSASDKARTEVGVEEARIAREDSATVAADAASAAEDEQTALADSLSAATVEKRQLARAKRVSADVGREGYDFVGKWRLDDESDEPLAADPQ